MKDILVESRKTLKSTHGLDTTNHVDYKNMLINDEAYEVYKSSLFESITKKADRRVVNEMADSMRESLLESVNNTYQITPYEVLSLPILSVFWPRLIAKELVTVMPIDAPEVIKPFLTPYFVDNANNRVDAPAMNYQSYGPMVKKSDGANFAPGAAVDLMAANGLTPSTTSIERTFTIYKIEDGSANTTDLNIRMDVDGNFSAAVSINGVADFISGHLDYDSGIIQVLSANGVVTKIYYACTFSLEQNVLNKKVKFDIEKKNLRVEDQEISAEWTVQLEQDLKSLWDLDFQSRIVSIIGEQMALDVDNKIITNLFDGINQFAPTSHIDTFDITPPSGYSWGPLYWYRNVLQKLSKLSATVYADTNIGMANVLALNPIDASIFEALGEFNYDGSAGDGGSIGYGVGTLSAKWKVLVSTVIPQGKGILIHKPTDEYKMIYAFAPYRPSVMIPYPLGSTPSLTVLSRNAHLLYRPNGGAILNFIQS